MQREKRSRRVELRATQTVYDAFDDQRGEQSQSDYFAALVLRDGRRLKRQPQTVDARLLDAVRAEVGEDAAARVIARFAEGGKA